MQLTEGKYCLKEKRKVKKKKKKTFGKKYIMNRRKKQNSGWWDYLLKTMISCVERKLLSNNLQTCHFQVLALLKGIKGEEF